MCPKCGSYSQNYGDSFCVNGHFIKDCEWVSENRRDGKEEEKELEEFVIYAVRTEEKQAKVKAF